MGSVRDSWPGNHWAEEMIAATWCRKQNRPVVHAQWHSKWYNATSFVKGLVCRVLWAENHVNFDMSVLSLEGHVPSERILEKVVDR